MVGTNVVNWDLLLENDFDRKAIRNFVKQELSGRGLYDMYVNTKKGGMVRNMLRTNGVNKARALARKALKRRNVKV